MAGILFASKAQLGDMENVEKLSAIDESPLPLRRRRRLFVNMRSCCAGCCLLLRYVIETDMVVIPMKGGRNAKLGLL